jgi:hypothetical protein
MRYPIVSIYTTLLSIKKLIIQILAVIVTKFMSYGNLRTGWFAKSQNLQQLLLIGISSEQRVL